VGPQTGVTSLGPTNGVLPGRIKDLMRAVITWHKDRMVVDPKYPRKLLTMGKAITALFVPHALIAAALVALLSDLLAVYPHTFDDGYASDGWNDPTWA